MFHFFSQINQMPESAVLQSAPYKCLQSQFSVLYGEVTQVGSVIIDHSLIIVYSLSTITLLECKTGCDFWSLFVHVLKFINKFIMWVRKPAKCCSVNFWTNHRVVLWVSTDEHYHDICCIYFFKLRQQLDDTRRVLSTTKTQHVLQLEQVEVHFVKILTL